MSTGTLIGQAMTLIDTSRDHWAKTDDCIVRIVSGQAKRYVLLAQTRGQLGELLFFFFRRSGDVIGG